MWKTVCQKKYPSISYIVYSRVSGYVDVMEKSDAKVKEPVLRSDCTEDWILSAGVLVC